MNYYYNSRLGISIKLFWIEIFSLSKGIIIPLVLGSIMLAIGYSSLSTYLIEIMVYALVYIFSMYRLGFNAQEKSIVDDILRKIFRR